MADDAERAREAQEEEEMEAIYNKCHRFKLGHGKYFCIDFNPVVTFVSVALIWGLVGFCMGKPDLAKDEFTSWMAWISDTWTWLYIGTQDVWAVFIVVLYFSKYGNMKLGKPDDEKEYSDVSYFTMLFAAGIGIGLFYFGVAEPIFHYTVADEKGNRYYGRYTDNQLAQDAMNLTFFHWGLHAWIVYVIVGLLLAFVAFRQDLPMSIRSCFHPLLGDRIYGLVGDVIDILSVICTMFGVCTSLGLGVLQVNAGLNRQNDGIPVSLTSQIIIIWCITALATLSVISGIKIGIRRLSEICFGLGLFIMMVVFFYDDTWFILNVLCQSIGYYLQFLLQLGFHTDAFAMEGEARDGLENPNWMDSWTIFYWGWWIAWSPFVGMFIAKISRGRTIKEFITHCMTIPTMYSFVWMAIFGGVGIKMERQAFLNNITCDSALGGATSTQADNGLFRLSCRTTNDMWFDVMESYEGIGTVLSILSLAGIILYFVTSSDSGSLVIDCLSANGHPDPPIIQRIFWALTEGACATALLVAGGSSGLVALRSVSITAGLPYTVLLNFFCVALWRAVKKEAGDMDPNGPAFYHDIFQGFWPSKRLLKLIAAIFIPWFYIGRADSRLNGTRPWCMWITLAVPFYAWIGLLCGEAGLHGLAYLGWPLYFFFAVFGGSVRGAIRERFFIEEGNMIEDLFTVLILYPLAAVQMDEHMDHMEVEEFRKKNDDYAPGHGGAPAKYDNGLYPMSDLADSTHHIPADQGTDNPAYKF